MMENNQLAKRGDTIEWTFEDSDKHADKLRGKTFQAEVATVNQEQAYYGVYASYGQDIIPFDQAKLIKVIEPVISYIDRQIMEGKALGDTALMKFAAKVYLENVGNVSRTDIIEHDFCAGWQSCEASKQNNGWIPTGQLPKVSEQYNVIVDLDDGGDYVSSCADYWVKENKWCYPGTELEYSGVLFYQPLPKPHIVRQKDIFVVDPKTIRTLDDYERNTVYGQCPHGNNMANCQDCHGGGGFYDLNKEE
ncbi:MAG: hypothetical protein V4547_18355 [Bacteroidota bacterium]